MPPESYVMVLNDGETFTNLKGCAIVGIPSDIPEDEVETYLKEGKGEYVRTFGENPLECDYNA